MSLGKRQSLFGVFGAVLGASVVSMNPAQAATLSTSGDAPTVDGADISNFLDGDADPENVNGGDDPFTYVATDRPAQGQTFTTGSDSIPGYTLSAVTVQNRNYELGYTDNADFGTSDIRIGSISGDSFVPIATETANLGDGNGFTSNGEGLYVTYTLDTPVVLAADTTYGFDLGSSGGFYETNGNIEDVFDGGSAYTSGGGGVGDGTVATYAGDRVFHLDLVPVPEPGSLALMGVAGLGLALRRRRP